MFPNGTIQYPEWNNRGKISSEKVQMRDSSGKIGEQYGNNGKHIWGQYRNRQSLGWLFCHYGWAFFPIPYPYLAFI